MTLDAWKQLMGSEPSLDDVVRLYSLFRIATLDVNPDEADEQHARTTLATAILAETQESAKGWSSRSSRKLNEIKSPYTQQEFDQRLKEKKISLEDFKRDIRRSITVDKVMNKEVSSKINVTDQDINDYFAAAESEFNLIEPQYHLAQIFVTPTPNPQVHNQNNKAQNEADARKKIQTISNRLDSGDDFATLAMNFSEDPETSGNGGDLGTVPESSLRNTDPGTRDTVLKLKPGQYSGIITLSNPATHQAMGFRIVKLVSKEPSGQRDLSDPRVQQAIRSQLHDRREQLLKAAYYELLRDSAKVENYYAKEVLDKNGLVK